MPLIYIFVVLLIFQFGLWSTCFAERGASSRCSRSLNGVFIRFNRIKIEVISVVAMQVLSIVDALSRDAGTFDFMGSTIRCDGNCGLFITMNPGYAGRTELPDNLKALMRPVAMMVPDLAMIAEVMLSAEGFTDARNLSKKTITSILSCNSSSANRTTMTMD